MRFFSTCRRNMLRAARSSCCRRQRSNGLRRS
nr:MAG TPA: hypothetical protein [Caudoviricetes sp.]